MRASICFLVLCVVSCRRAPAPAPVVDAASAPSAARVSPVVASTASSAAPPAITITNVGPAEFEITSDGGALATAARIERREADGSWRALEHLDVDRGYRLVDDCAKSDACVQAQALRPVPWSGFNCSAQCNGTCRANGWEGPGTFRLSVSSCDGKTMASGPSFELPDSAHLESTARRFAVTDVLSVTAMRLDVATAPGEVGDAARGDRVAGFPVRGPSRPLDGAQVTELTTLLRSDHGFDDHVTKRCAVEHLVGFRITHRLATLGLPRQQVVDMAVDFRCHKLLLARGDGSKRAVDASHFDPSRTAFLALARAAFPADSELAALR